MTVQEVYSVSGEATVFIVKRDERNAVVAKRMYIGEGKSSRMKVTRITPTISGLWGPILELDVEEEAAP